MSLEEKQWIIMFKAENHKMSQVQVAHSFAARFNRSITRQSVCAVLKKQNEIMANILADPDLNLSKAKYVKNIGMAKFEAELLLMLEEQCKTTPITHELVRQCFQAMQKLPEYADNKEIQIMKFSSGKITSFLNTHGISLSRGNYALGPLAGLALKDKF